MVKIPTTDLNVSLGVTKKAARIAGHLSLEIVHAGLCSPLSSNRGGDLHQSNLAIFSGLPGTEVSLFINDAPDEIRVESIDGGLPGHQKVIAMNPVLVEEIGADHSDEDHEDNEDDEEQTFHSDSFWDQLVRTACGSGRAFSRIRIRRGGPPATAGGSDIARLESVSPFQSRPETHRAGRAIDAFIAQPQRMFVEYVPLQPDFSGEGCAHRQVATT